MEWWEIFLATLAALVGLLVLVYRLTSFSLIQILETYEFDWSKSVVWRRGKFYARVAYKQDKLVRYIGPYDDIVGAVEICKQVSLFDYSLWFANDKRVRS